MLLPIKYESINTLLYQQNPHWVKLQKQNNNGDKRVISMTSKLLKANGSSLQTYSVCKLTVLEGGYANMRVFHAMLHLQYDAIMGATLIGDVR